MFISFGIYIFILYKQMANLGVSKRTASIIFAIMVLVGALLTSIYIVLSTKLTQKTEGFGNLEPMCKSELCEGASAHEVPIWKGSLVPEKPKAKAKRVDDATYKSAEQPGKQTNAKSKPNKYSFIDTQIDKPVEEKPVVKPPTEQKFIGDLNKTAVKRPRLTATGLVKQPKGRPDGLGFNTGAIN
jgi:hypothetical protein